MLDSALQLGSCTDTAALVLEDFDDAGRVQRVELQPGVLFVG